MDIPVSRLNQRMALQLPAEFPLGLVFVVGIVDDLKVESDGREFNFFYLLEGSYRVRCLLSDRVPAEITIKNGDKIRAGGHLAFDPQKADYYLLARDIELLTLAEPNLSSGSAILADIDRRSQETGLVPADLPVWVKQLAPPELMAELGMEAQIDIEEEDEPEPDEKAESSPQTPVYELNNQDTMLTMSDELIEFLSKAMDSTEEIELTPEVIAHLGTPGDPEVYLAESASSRLDEEMVEVGPDDEAPSISEDHLVDFPGSDILDDIEGGVEEPAVPEGLDGRGSSMSFDAGEKAESGARGVAAGEMPEATNEKGSGSAWPEVILVLLILVALFLTFAVVYVVAAR